MLGFVNLSKVRNLFQTFNYKPIIHITLVDNNFSTHTLKNAWVKMKHNNMLSPIIESTKKNNKAILHAMEKKNDTQHDIKQHSSKVHDATWNNTFTLSQIKK